MRPLLLLMLASLLTSGILIVGKLAGTAQVPPLSLLLWQVGGGGLLLWVVMLIKRPSVPLDRRHLAYYHIAGMLGVSLPFSLSYFALREIPVGFMGLISALSPLMTYSMARLLGREPGSRRRLYGLSLGLIGVAVIMLPDEPVMTTAAWTHVLAAFGVPLSLAAGNLYRSLAWPAGSDPLPLATGMVTTQSLWLLPITLASGQFQLPDFHMGDTGLWGAALALMAGGSYLASLSLLRVGGPVFLSQIGYVVTIVTVAVGAAVLGEQYEARDWATMGLIFIGIWLTGMPQKQFTVFAANRRRLKTRYPSVMSPENCCGH